MRCRSLLGLTLAAVLLPAAPVLGQDDTIFRSLSDQKLEEMLSDLGVRIDAGPIPSKDPKNKSTTWDYTSNKYKIRIISFAGKDLMLSAVFGETTLEVVNAWNLKTKFTRAAISQDKVGKYSVVEANLNVAPGITKSIFREFIRGFDRDVQDYQEHLLTAVAEEDLHRTVSDPLIETVLKGMNQKFTRKAGAQEGTTVFDFERKGFKVRLTNFGGKDLMLHSDFAKEPLTKLNEWNLKQKFVRAVGYNPASGAYCSLETNLDCGAGMTASIIRNFIANYDFEVAAFSKFLSK